MYSVRFFKHISTHNIFLTQRESFPLLYIQYFTKQCTLTPPAGSRGDSSSTAGGDKVKGSARAQKQCDRSEHPEESGGRTGRGHSRPQPHDHRERQPERETQGTISVLISSTPAYVLHITFMFACIFIL